MRGWGIEERRQSDVSAYSRAKERIVTGGVRRSETFGVRGCEGVVNGKLECSRSGTSVIEGQGDFAP